MKVSILYLHAYMFFRKFPGNVIAKLDEAQQILNYCKFQFHASAEAYRALYEYCYNAEYGNQFREDIIKM